MRRLALILVIVAGCGAAREESSSPRPVADRVLARAGEAALARPLVVQPEPKSTRGEVVLVPLGDFPADLIDDVERRLVEEFAVTIRRHAAVPLPPAAYYAPRKRYRADRLLDHLHTLEADPDARILGLTEVDISTTKGNYKDWGIFGLGELPGRTSVISMYRLRRKARDREHLRFRVGTTAVHEIGHTFGLDHCDEAAARCAMQDAEGSIANTDSSTGKLAAGCRTRLDQNAPL